MTTEPPGVPRVRVLGRIPLSTDGFHHPRAHRHGQGRDSAAGYHADAHDFPAFARTVLDRPGPGGDVAAALTCSRPGQPG